METSSRNSEVIHAGLYYPPGSNKAKLCVEGKKMLYSYLSQKKVPYNNCGKLVVATVDDQLQPMRDLKKNAEANGVDDLRIIGEDEIKQLEPDVHAIAAIHSPSSGVFDSHAYMTALLADIEEEGGTVSFNAKFKAGEVSDNGITVEVTDTEAQEDLKISTRWLINCAGVHAHHVANHIEGLPKEEVPEISYVKGNYFSIHHKVPFKRLIYPMPENGGLGTHLTLDLAGQARFGPDVEWMDHIEPDAIDYKVDPARHTTFVENVKKYWPTVNPDHLQPDYSGVRAKVTAKKSDDPRAGDFNIKPFTVPGVGGVLNLFGIESPGLTSSLAIAKKVADTVATNANISSGKALQDLNVSEP